MTNNLSIIIFFLLSVLPISTFSNSNTDPHELTAIHSATKQLQNELAAIGVEKFTASNYKPGTVRHIVLFRYKKLIGSQEKAMITERFLALRQLCKRNGVPYIVSIETGTQNSGEGADQGFQQAFVVTFKSEGDRNYYVGQPIVTNAHFYDLAHQTFKEYVGALLDQNGALVFDFHPV